LEDCYLALTGGAVAIFTLSAWKTCALRAPSLLQFRYPAFHRADNFSLALPARLFLMPGLQVLQFFSSALYYLHNRIHEAITPSLIFVYRPATALAQHDE
jgi:hypothetical protein